MSNYKDYPCWDCAFYANCGRTNVNNAYKFGKSGDCHAYKYDSKADEIIIEKRQNDFRRYIEFAIDNRVPREMW